MRTARATFAAVAIAALAAGAPAAEGEGAAPAIKWDALSMAVRTIESAKTPDEAIKAYAKGCSVNRRSAKLQEAYMLRMLTFGRVDVAMHAAQALEDIDPKHGLALGVIGYEQARRGQLATALVTTMKAVQAAPENPGICQNAAQLVAWLEGAKRERIPSVTVEAAKEFKSLGKLPAAAYQKARKDYGALEQEKRKKEQEAQKVSSEAKKLKSEWDTLSDKLKSLGRQYENEEKRHYQTRRSLAQAEDRVNRARDYRSRRSYERQVNSLRRRLRDLAESMKDHVREAKKIRGQIQDAKTKYESKSRQAFRLKREAAEIQDGVPSTFAWKPPAVDGKITPDSRDAKPASRAKGKDAGKAPKGASYLLGGDSKPSPAGKPEPKAATLADQVAEAEAADKLSLAKICADSDNADMKSKARSLLKEIVSKYPDTKAAAKAADLLKKLD